MTDTTTQNLRPLREAPKFERRAPGVGDHAHVEAQREMGDLARDSIGMIHVFSQDALFELLNDDLTRQVEVEGALLRGITSGPIYDFYANSVLMSNGARHTARRRPLARTFAFPLMRALRPEIREAVDALLAGIDRDAPVDFLERVAGPLPAGVIARILGVPEADAPRFAALVYSAIRILQNRSAEVLEEAARDLAALENYVNGLMEARRAEPRDDFLSRFIADADAGGDLDENEIRIQIVSLIFGGSDTTRAALTMAVTRLLEHPDQWRMLCADPETWKGPAVEEALRFDPVVGGLGRVAIRDFDFRGWAIREGTIFAPSIVGAMRDPAVYADPFRFDITRTDHPRHTPAFGGGPHRCLGEALARVELEEALAALAAAWPDMAIEGPPPELKGLSGTRSITGLTLRPEG
ncbi:MAG: cytochrome P450 [Pseudooceanicola sp.]